MSFSDLSFEMLKEKFLTTEGRLNRLRYFKYGLIAGLFSVVVSIILQTVATLVTGNPEGFLVRAVSTVVSFLWFVVYICLVIRRLHDLNKKELFAVLAIIPMVNFFFGIYLLLAKGTVGYNQYGPDPLL